MLSKQEIFNEAYTKVLKQGRRCADMGHCMYFNDENGDMCAAGHVMNGRVPDDSAMWEHKGPVRELRAFYEDELPWSKELDGFVEEIQRAHDNCFNGSFVRNYKTAMVAVATFHGLTIPEEANCA